MTAKGKHTSIDICANCCDCSETDDVEVLKCNNEYSDHYQHFMPYTHYSCVFFEQREVSNTTEAVR